MCGTRKDQAGGTVSQVRLYNRTRARSCALAGLSLEPLIGALAAGNAVALKPSELSPCTARFLADNIGGYIDASAVKVVNGGPEVGGQLMEHRWDKVLFTGRPIQPPRFLLPRGAGASDRGQPSV